MKKCKNLKRINNIKMITFCLICALVALFFKISMVTPTYAWYIDDNNNMSSSNLFDIQTVNLINDSGVITEKNSTGLVVTNNTNSEWSRVTVPVNLESYQTYTITYNQTTTSYLYIFDNVGNVYRGDSQNVSNSLNQQYTFTSLSNVINFAFYAPIGSTNTITNIMINIGSTALAYEPYGMTYFNPNNIDLMQYLLGNNYFSHGRVMAYQTSDGNYYDRRIYPSNWLNNAQITEETINQYINGNILNLGTLCVDLLADLSTKSNYSTSNSTFIALKPALAINGTATYPPVECRYIDLYIYCPNTLTTASCLIGGSGDIDYNNHQRVEFTKEGDYIHVYFDDDNYNYIWDIDIRIDYSNGWVFPQTVRCDLENNPNFNMYDLGVESGFQRGLVEGQQNGYNKGKIDGYNWGYEQGKQAGYNEGVESSFETSGFKTLLNSIISYPINLVKNSLDFNFMGVNVGQIIMFIISLGIVAFVIHKFKE